jgi:four helix bundle protein
MDKNKPYNLEERTYKFAIDVRSFLRNQKQTKLNIDDFKQVIRSSGSIGANYLEANAGMSKKDLLYRLRLCRKEAKETNYWLKIIHHSLDGNNKELIQPLISESFELIKIFSSIIEKVK